MPFLAQLDLNRDPSEPSWVSCILVFVQGLFYTQRPLVKRQTCLFSLWHVFVKSACNFSYAPFHCFPFPYGLLYGMRSFCTLTSRVWCAIIGAMATAARKVSSAALSFPRQRIYLCNWYVELVKPGNELPNNHVQCHVPMQ